jgi:hypothetical protein
MAKARNNLEATSTEALDLDTLGAEWKALNERIKQLRPTMRAAVQAARAAGGQGTTYQQLAERSGVAIDTVRLWLNPEAEDRQYASRRVASSASVPQPKGRRAAT